MQRRPIYCRAEFNLDYNLRATELLIHRHHREIGDAAHIEAPAHEHVAAFTPSTPKRIFDDPVRECFGCTITYNRNCR
jgi:hypothetical protein